jgi:hypothetical protein
MTKDSISAIVKVRIASPPAAARKIIAGARTPPSFEWGMTAETLRAS